MLLAACGSKSGGALGSPTTEGTAQSKTLQLSKSANAGEQWLSVQGQDENAVAPNRHSKVQYVFNYKPHHKLQVIYLSETSSYPGKALPGDTLTLGDLKGLSQSQVTAKAKKVALGQAKESYQDWKSIVIATQDPVTREVKPERVNALKAYGKLHDYISRVILDNMN